nr:retrovirus-related Pol polyprotein from transposon TNT 1-94 [Tanacetum cinerariifolium]
MKSKYQGNTRVKKAQLQRLRKEFETLEMKEDEGVTEYFGRVMIIANDMRNFGEEMTEVKVVEKILRSLTEKFNYVVCSIEESKDTDAMTVDELQSSLLVHEQKFIRKTSEDQVMRAEFESPSGRGRSRGRGSLVKGRGRGRGRGRSEIDKSSLECYRCHKLGHFAYECTNEDKDVNYAEFDEDEGLLLMAHAEVKNEEKSGIWLLDSACSNHITGDKDWFINLDEGFKHSVKLRNDLRLKVKGIGDIRFGVEGVTQVISRVYYIPELTSNLLSVGQLQEKDFTIIIKKGMCKVYHPQRGMIAYSKMTKNRMFVVKATMKPLGTKCLKVEDDDNEQIWHMRLGYVKPIGVKWLYKTKLNERGEIIKHKARLVVKGYSQRKGLDYDEVYASVSRWDTVRSLVVVAARKKWEIHQLDVKCAFLNRELKETVFINQPHGFIKEGEEFKVCRLKKALYGLNQAPRAWFTRIECYFVREGFQKSDYDHTLFTKNTGERVVIVSLYVDDLIYTGNDKELCNSFKLSMMKEFKMTDLGSMKYFLGVEVNQNAEGISMCQKRYAKEVLQRFQI